MGEAMIRHGEPADFEPAVAVWLAANSARRKAETRSRAGSAGPRSREQSRSVLLVARCRRCGGHGPRTQGLADDGAGPPEGTLPRLDGLRCSRLLGHRPRRGLVAACSWRRGRGAMTKCSCGPIRQRARQTTLRGARIRAQ